MEDINFGPLYATTAATPSRPKTFNQFTLDELISLLLANVFV
jgi:hypothetical protein